MEERRVRLLVVDQEPGLGDLIGGFLGPSHVVVTARERAEMLARLHRETNDLVVLSVAGRPDAESLEEALRAAGDVSRFSPGTLVLMVGVNLPPERILEAARAGVHDFVGGSADPHQLELAIRRALEHRRLQSQVRRLQDELARRSDLRSIKGSSPAISQVRLTLTRLAGSTASVLVRGEPGTGKGLVCRALHATSPHRDGPFVAFNCAALPASLVDAELFGVPPPAGRHLPPSPRGALVRASGGTLHIAEPGSLPEESQGRLLEAVRSGRAGREASVGNGVRLVSSMARDPHREVRDGRLDPALLRALAEVTIEIPPLRERREDIPVLAEYFLEQGCRDHRKPRKRIARDALDCLSEHLWKGNVRELEDTIEALVLLTHDESIEARHLPRPIRDRRPSASVAAVGIPDGGVVLSEQMAEFERTLLLSAIEKSGGRKKEAAALLGLNKDQMKYLCRKHNV